MPDKIKAAVFLGIAAFFICTSTALADDPERVTLRVQSLFYGDNTEFSNVLREGDTTFGTYNKFFVSGLVSDRVHLDLGIGLRQINGKHTDFDIIKPIISLRVGSPTNQFVFGSLTTGLRNGEIGPDLETPHGLIPPVQVETLLFNRPHESGIQWLMNKKRVRYDTWINWQRINTPEHRERFDAGAVSQIGSGMLRGVWQAHVAHEGGQLYMSGPVSDSVAYVGGLSLDKDFNIGHFKAEGDLVYSSYTPNREVQDTKLRGKGIFTRISLQKTSWRWHAIAWQGHNFVKDEGDLNYQSLVGDVHLGDIAYFHKSVDYGEAGLTRSWQADPMRFEVSFRFHMIQRNFGYSYRLLGVLDLKKVVW